MWNAKREVVKQWMSQTTWFGTSNLLDKRRWGELVEHWLNQSHGQVGRPSFLGNGGLLPNCVLEMSWKIGQSKHSKKWDSLFCVCFGETNVHQHTS